MKNSRLIVVLLFVIAGATVFIAIAYTKLVELASKSQAASTTNEEYEDIIYILKNQRGSRSDSKYL